MVLAAHLYQISNMPVTSSNPAGAAPTNNLGGYATTLAEQKTKTISAGYTAKSNWDTAVRSLITTYTYESELTSLYTAYQNLQNKSNYKTLLNALVNDLGIETAENNLHLDIIANRLSTYYYTKTKEYLVYMIDTLTAKIQANASNISSLDFPLRSNEKIILDKVPRIERFIDTVNYVRFTKQEKDRHDTQIRTLRKKVKTDLWDSGKKDEYATYIIGLGINHPN